MLLDSVQYIYHIPYNVIIESTHDYLIIYIMFCFSFFLFFPIWLVYTFYSVYIEKCCILVFWDSVLCLGYSQFTSFFFSQLSLSTYWGGFSLSVRTQSKIDKSWKIYVEGKFGGKCKKLVNITMTIWTGIVMSSLLQPGTTQLLAHSRK